MNKVILMGNLTRDPELKYLENGTAVANFGVAHNERYTNRETQEQRETTTFVEVEVWDRQAEVISEYFQKGSRILLEGALKYETWEEEDGTRRSRLKVRLFRFNFVDRRGEVGDGSNTPNAPTDNQGAQRPSQQSQNETDSSVEEDIPF